MSQAIPSAFSASVDLRLAVGESVHVLHRALVGLDARELEAGCRVDGLGKRHDVRRGLDATAPGTAIDLDQAFDGGAVLHGGRRKVGHVVQHVHAADRPRAKLRQARKAVDLRRVADLIADQHILDPATGEDLGLGHLLAADTDGAAQPLLQQGHIDRLVHLAVHPVTHAVGAGIVAHLLDVPLQRVEVEEQAGRLDVGLVHPRKCRDIVADFQALEIRLLVHGISLSSRGVCPDRRCRR